MAADALAPCITKSSVAMVLDSVGLTGLCIPCRKISTTCAFLVLRNGKKSDHIFVFSEIGAKV